jgi:hypothetical protein
MSDPIAAALARYVEQLTPPTAPPFEQVRLRARRRWRRPAWLLSLLAVLAAAGTGGLIVAMGPASQDDHRPNVVNVVPSAGPLNSPSVGASAVPPSAGGLGSAISATPTGPPAIAGVPQHLVVAGESLHLQRQDPAATVYAGWVDVDDPTMVDLVAGLDLADTGGGCYPYTVAYVLAETGTAVSVSAFDYQRDGPVTGSCNAIGGAPKVHRLQLARPLAGRPVIDQGRPIRVSNPHTMLAATYLPPGYAKPGRFLDLDRPTWTYSGPGGSSLSVILNRSPGPTPTTAPLEYDRTIKQVTVRGKPGTAWTWAPNVCVEWYEQGGAPFNVCGPPGGDGATSIDELVKVADGLTVDGR